MSDKPFYEIVTQAETLIEDGATVYQKFTCASCGKRLTMEEPNLFYKQGTCDECGHITDIGKQGCGFLLVLENLAR